MRPAELAENQRVSRAVEELNRRMLRARDAIDRAYAEPLDIPSLAAVAHVSDAHFIRTFRATFGLFPPVETPLDNIGGAHVTREYRWWTAAGARRCSPTTA